MSVRWYKGRRFQTALVIFSTVLFVGALIKSTQAEGTIWIAVSVLGLIANVAWLVWERPKVPV